LARASTTTATAVERCWTLVGQRRGRIWLARRVRPRTGERTRVDFDGLWVLQREEHRGDVVGFLHTHPDGPDSPSLRDVRTMRAWCGAFGKPLLCLIHSPAGVRGFSFASGDADAKELSLVELFPRGVVIGVEHGKQVSS
jgi:proteasome lid subunit RPN8/RPN11